GGGGGGGGSGTPIAPPCSQDVWTCGEWGTCSIAGEQARTCTKTFDCASTETPPQPSGVQRCTPSCVADQWTCNAWSACGTDGHQRRVCGLSFDCPISNTPGKPSEDQRCQLDCGNDVWECNAWSACGAAGERTRACARRLNCKDPDAPEPKPSERQRCTPPPRPPQVPAARPTPPAATPPGLICGNLQTLEERIRCRITLSREALDRELAIQYLPEECRAIPGGGARVTCVARYQNLRPCWSKPIGPERFACVRSVLGLRNLREERADCDAKQGTDRAQCLGNLRTRGYPYITFRFYDLEERAEGLKDLGAPLDLVVQFVATAEQAKQDFNAANTKDERIAMIRRVQSAWRTFVAQLSDDVKDRARNEGIGSSY
ncbi:hypothetical protein HY480_04810, partial [Candidatus Uhrbacteria bacterium]|nr:hypothetical protein [Candidatus Uhrbacteria bacterium]